MKRNLILKCSFLVLAFSFFQIAIYSQCPTCEPDTSCTNPDGPTSCPEVLPDAIANEYYEEVVTFYLPNTFTDPDSGFDVTLNVVTITGVTGIPFGMEFMLNEEDMTYNPSEGENHGCATICGTPILSGIYEGLVSFSADVVVLGIDLTINQSFPILLNVLEGEGANNSFSFDQISACGELEVTFEALINGAPQPTEWYWDFGNGYTSSEQFPGAQYYAEPGEYTVSLETQFYNYTLTEVILTDLSSGWAGDIEELIEAFTSPDPFFVIENADGDAIYTSTSVDNTTSNTWGGLNIELTNFPYTINWYDEDNITDDDFLGSYTITGDLGVLNFYVNSGTTGSVNHQLLEDDLFYNEETVLVFDFPEVELGIDEENHIASIDDSSVEVYQWYLDGELLDGETSMTIEMTEWGIYSCYVTNNFGCSAFTDEYANCPDFEIAFNSETDILSTPFEFVTYQWFYNGLPLEGETNDQISSLGGGNYWVEITTSYGCGTVSEPFIMTGIEEAQNQFEIEVYPNPSQGKFIINSNANNTPLDIRIFDLQGRIIKELPSTFDFPVYIELDDTVEAGIYLLTISSENGTRSQRILIE